MITYYVHLLLVFERLGRYGAKIKIWKCQFFKHEVSYLGRVTSVNRYTNDPKQIASIASKIRRSQIIRRLGLIGYFRQSIPYFSRKAKVSFDLLRGQENNKTSEQPVQWEMIHQEALDELRTHLITPSLLV